MLNEQLGKMPGRPRILECGTRSQGKGSQSKRNLFYQPERFDIFGLDIEAGPGVDIVADLHSLSSVQVNHPPFDAILCTAVLEHVIRPWVVAPELARVCRPGGVLYVATHQTFPLHYYPSDYFRFSADALRVIFCEEAGWRVTDAGHEFPCKVIPLENYFPHAHDWNFLAEAFLGSWCLAERI